MDRISVRLPERQLAHVDMLVDDGLFTDRSEAVRAALRKLNAEYQPQPSQHRRSR